MLETDTWRAIIVDTNLREREERVSRARPAYRTRIRGGVTKSSRIRTVTGVAREQRGGIRIRRGANSSKDGIKRRDLVGARWRIRLKSCVALLWPAAEGEEGRDARSGGGGRVAQIRPENGRRERRERPTGGGGCSLWAGVKSGGRWLQVVLAHRVPPQALRQVLGAVGW